jgi:hypothetical protein
VLTIDKKDTFYGFFFWVNFSRELRKDGFCDSHILSGYDWSIMMQLVKPKENCCQVGRR